MSLFNLSHVIALLGTSATVSVQRPDASTFGAGGFAAAQTFTTLTISNASVQPMSGTEKVSPPEGVRREQVVTVHAPSFEMLIRDRLTIPSKGVFEVFHVDPWNAAGNFSRALARELNSSEPRS